MRVLLALLLLVVACGAPAPANDAGTMVDAGVDAGPAPLVGVRVMTWNVRQLGADGGSSARVGELIRAQRPDLVTVQEVGTAAAYDSLLAVLSDGGYDGHLGTLAATSGNLMQAVFWRRGKLTVTAPEDLFTSEASTFPRPPLGWTTRLTERDAGFQVIAVHLKAGIGTANEQTRIDALLRLDATLRARIDAGASEQLLLGDFNEAPSDPRSAEAFAPFGVEPLRALTPGLADAGLFTFLPRQLLLDHVVVSRALDAGVPFAPRLDQSESDYTLYSDHLPLILELGF